MGVDRAATTLAERGHAVEVFEAAAQIGSHFYMAKRVPGKEEFEEMLRYFARRLKVLGVTLHLDASVTTEFLCSQKFVEVVPAAGVLPRDPKIPGRDHPMAAAPASPTNAAPSAPFTRRAASSFPPLGCRQRPPARRLGVPQALATTSAGLSIEVSTGDAKRPLFSIDEVGR